MLDLDERSDVTDDATQEVFDGRRRVFTQAL